MLERHLPVCPLPCYHQSPLGLCAPRTVPGTRAASGQWPLACQPQVPRPVLSCWVLYGVLCLLCCPLAVARHRQLVRAQAPFLRVVRPFLADSEAPDHPMTATLLLGEPLHLDHPLQPHAVQVAPAAGAACSGTQWAAWFWLVGCWVRVLRLELVEVGASWDQVLTHPLHPQHPAAVLLVALCCDLQLVAVYGSEAALSHDQAPRWCRCWYRLYRLPLAVRQAVQQQYAAAMMALRSPQCRP